MVMDVEAAKIELRQFVADGKHGKALETLFALSHTQSKSLQERIFSLSTAYKKYRQEIGYGWVNDEEDHLDNNQFNQEILAIVDALKPPAYGLDKNASFLRNRHRILLIFSLILLMGVLYVIFFNPRPDEPQGPIGQAEWTGEWNTEIEATSDKTLKGVLTFEIDKTKPEAIANITYSNGNKGEFKLYELVFTKVKMKGKWESVDLSDTYFGDFEFMLQNSNSFNGYYTIHPEKTRFFWNGRK